MNSEHIPNDSELMKGPVEKNIPPFPHAPNWCYMCPHCFKNWEMAERCEDFRIPCSECVRILIGGSKR